MKIRGYVKNLDDPDESVEIVAQHPDYKVLEEYIKKIKINDGMIEVHEIIKEEATEKEHKKFEVIRGSPEEENAERLDVAEIQLKKLTQAVISGDKDLGEKITTGNKELGEKITTGNRGLGEKLDNVSGNVEIVAGKIDNLGVSVGIVGGKIDNLGIKLDSFSNATTDRFDTVDTKYGKISDRLERICVSLEELVGILRVFKPKE